MWRTYIIGPDRQRAREFYAPNLDHAFHLARLRFGSLTLTTYTD
jgi:hypothetical protein